MINRNVFTSMLFLVVTIFFILCQPVHSSTQETLTMVKNGLESGKGIAELLEKKNFGQSLSKIGKSVVPYLSAVGPFIGLLTVIFPSTSNELVYMKDMMKFIDTRLNQVDERLDNFGKIIENSRIERIEEKIRAMELKFKKLYSATPDTVEYRKTRYISAYNNFFDVTSMELYDYIVGKRGLHSRSLASNILKYTDSNRKKTQLYLLGVMQLLLQAVKIELSFLYLTADNHNIDSETTFWTNKIKEVQKKFHHIDVQCVNAYHSKSGNDIDKYSAQHKGMSNQQFAVELWKLLCSKYYWRDWIVVVYDPIVGYEHHTVRVSGGHIKFRIDGRNILVASVDKRHPFMNLARAEREMKSKSMTYRYRSSGFWYRTYKKKRNTARKIFNSLDKTGASLVGVIRCYAHVGFITYTNRFAAVDRCPQHYMLLMWG